MKNTILLTAAILYASQLQSQNLILDSLFAKNGRALFNFNNYDDPSKLLMQPDGKFLAGGSATGSYDIYTAIARFDICGIPDSSFAGDGLLMHSFDLRNIPNDIALQDDGGIVCAGVEANSNAGSAQIPFVSRYTSAGETDATFDSDGFIAQRFDPISSGGFYSVKVYPDHRILCIGTSSANANGGVNGYGAMRFMPDGTFDTSFDGDGMSRYTLNAASPGEVRGHVLSDGNIVTVFSYYNNYPFNIFMGASALDSTGALIGSFGTSGIFVDTISINSQTYTDLQNDEQIVMAAAGAAYNTVVVTRISAQGVMDNTFGNNGHTVFTAPGVYSLTVKGLRIISDGRILVFGQQGAYPFVVVLNPDGSPDNNFGNSGYVNPDWNNGNGYHYVKDIFELSNGQWLIAGISANDCLIGRLIETSNVPHPSYDGVTLATTGGDFFQWYFEGNVISAATGNTYIPQQLGYYNVVATDSFGCSYISDSVLVQSVSADLMLNNKFIRVFPNPVSDDYLYFESGGEKIIEVVIYHLSGKELKRVQDKRGIAKVDFDFPAGSYLVTLKTDNFISSQVILNAED